jgi:hypothetical protein
MLAELLRGTAALSTAGALIAGTWLTARAEIAPTPVTPVTEAPPFQADQAPTDWVTVPIGVVPANDDRAGSERPTASAKSLQLSPLKLCVSCTQAASGGAQAHSGASALTVLGTGLSGGESSGTGSRSGALVMVPANPLLGLAIATWMADTRADGSAHSRASLVDIAIGPRSHGRRAGTGDDRGEGAVTMSVIESKSDSKSDEKKTEKKTEGAAETNAVDAGTNDQALAVALAHSDSSGDGQGKAYVAGVNKGELVSSEQTGEGIPVEVPGVTKVVLVQKTATDGTAAAVAKVDAPPADAAASAPTAEVASTATAVSTVRAASEVSTPATGTAAVTPASGGAGAVGIPTTGAEVSLAGLGTLLLIIGAGILGLSSRRRATAAR